MNLGRVLPIRNTRGTDARSVQNTLAVISWGELRLAQQERLGEEQGKGREMDRDKEGGRARVRRKNTAHVKKMGSESEEPSDLDNRLTNVEN